MCVCYTQEQLGFFSRILHPSFGGAYYTHVRAIHKTLQYLHPLERLEFVGDSFSTFFRDLIFCPKLFDYIQVKLGFLILCGG